MVRWRCWRGRDGATARRSSPTGRRCCSAPSRAFRARPAGRPRADLGGDWSAQAGARDLRSCERAGRRAGVPAAAALHVGDSLSADITGAQAAGFAAVWLPRRGAAAHDGAVEPPPDAVIERLTDLLDLLDLLD
ncbi:MAG: HAD family hydrolase [Dehalococcoidia bacterium]|nr:HAD family hydrolase [Dehalococcoidia bacterium]